MTQNIFDFYVWHIYSSTARILTRWWSNNKAKVSELLTLWVHCRICYVSVDLYFIGTYVDLFFSVALRPNAGHGFLIREVSRSHTTRRTIVGRTPLDERPARRRNLYLTTQNTHNRQTSMTQVVFEPTISAGERPQNYALDRAATVTGYVCRLL